MDLIDLIIKILAASLVPGVAVYWIRYTRRAEKRRRDYRARNFTDLTDDS